MTGYSMDLLRRLTPEQVRRRHLAPVNRFTNSDIQSGDYDTWEKTEFRFASDRVDREKVAWLVEDIQRNGLCKKVEIIWLRTGGSLHVSDGHHRVVALKRMGWPYIPYRWCTPNAWGGMPGYLRGRLPEPDGSPRQ